MLIALYLYDLMTHDVELFTVKLCYDGTLFGQDEYEKRAIY